MKHFILWASLLAATHIQAQQLYDYHEVKSALKEGSTIRIVTDFSRCSPDAKLASAANVGVFSPAALQIVNDHIVTSMKHFTLDNPGFPNMPVYEYVKYTLNKNNTLDLSYVVLSVIDYSKLTSKRSWNCPLNSGVKIFS